MNLEDVVISYIMVKDAIAVNDHISSKDKSVLKNPGGHVSLCVSSNAHKKLWPEVAKWLISR